MFACLAVPRQTAGAADTLLRMAREWSPRVERHGDGVVVLDVNGVERLFGEPAVLGEALRRAGTSALNEPVHVAIASTRIAALVLACAMPGVTIVPAGGEVGALAALPLTWLSVLEGPAGPTRSLASSRKTASAGRRRARGSARHYRLAPIPSEGERAGRSTVEPTPAVELVATLRRWGLRTFGEFTALPPIGVSERLGEAGLAWQRLARGEDPGPLVPALEETRYEESLALEWPVEGLEPLAFVLGRLLEALCARLMRDDRGAATLSVRLRLVTREIHARTLQLPLPFRDPRVLRTLAILDLESHPPPAAIDVIQVAVDPVPGRVVYTSLLDRARPSAEQLSTLRARIQALMGEGRSGAPHLVETHRPGAFVLVPFEGERRSIGRGARPPDIDARAGTSGMSGAKPLVLSADAGCPAGNAEDGRGRPVSRSDMPDVPAVEPVAGVLRRFRHPVPAQVTMSGGCPVRVLFTWGDLRGGIVQACAGPWRTSGDWWRTGVASDGPLPPWDHDEWDVALADGGLYRIYRDRADDRWYLDAVID